MEGSPMRRLLLTAVVMHASVIATPTLSAAFIKGTRGNNALAGTDRRDTIVALAGHDRA